MSLLLYAIADGKSERGDVLGLHGEPLSSIQGHGLAMIVGERDPGTATATERDLREYERVLERLMHRRTILPARFGTELAGAEAALRILDLRHEEFTRTLAHVRGAVELVISATWSGGELSPADTRSGTAYMRARLELRRRAKGVEAHLTPLRELARNSAIRLLPRPEQPISGAYLLSRARVEQFAEEAGRLAASLDQVTLDCTGPWPPYSFVGSGG